MRKHYEFIKRLRALVEDEAAAFDENNLYY